MLNIDIGGTTAGTGFDQFKVSGSATLNGTVAVSLINGYAPAAGTTVPFLTYGSESGSFATVTDTNLHDSIGFSVSYDSGDAIITTTTVTPQAVVASPSGMALTAAASSPSPSIHDLALLDFLGPEDDG